jgi:putative ABC transport system permease protein
MVHRQTNYMREKDLGFNKNGIIVFYADRNQNIGLESLKDELMKIKGVKQITASSNVPGTRPNTTDIWERGKPPGESSKAVWVYADHDYVPTLELTLVAGRNFNANGTDAEVGAIINENAVAALGWTPEEAIGKKILGFSFSDSLPGEIIGVIKDFHIAPLRKEIIPLVIAYSKTANNYLVRVEGTSLNLIPGQVDKIGAKHSHGDKVESQFLEDVLKENYGAEIKTGQMLTFFTFLAILIGCSGLYALSAFEGDQRTKELGIRKIMGASTQQLLFILSRDFLKLIFLSLFIALPLAYFLGNMWLSIFAYRAGWSAEIFLMAAGFVLGLGWLTILTQAIKASRLNPVDALRYE